MNTASVQAVSEKSVMLPVVESAANAGCANRRKIGRNMLCPRKEVRYIFDRNYYYTQ